MATLAVQFPTYQPAMRIISAITNAFPALVTTSFAHQYKTGLIVRLNIPLGFGMLAANQKTGIITVISDTTFEINIDTTQFEPYVVSGTYPFSYQSGQVTPIAEANSLLNSSIQNVLPYTQ